MNTGILHLSCNYFGVVCCYSWKKSCMSTLACSDGTGNTRVEDPKSHPARFEHRRRVRVLKRRSIPMATSADSRVQFRLNTARKVSALACLALKAQSPRFYPIETTQDRKPGPGTAVVPTEITARITGIEAIMQPSRIASVSSTILYPTRVLSRTQPKSPHDPGLTARDPSL